MVCVVYVVKEVASFWGARFFKGRGTIEHALKLYRPAERYLLVSYRTNS